jgi:hypothetical protein
MTIITIDLPMVIFEMALGLWLLFKGLSPSGQSGPDKAKDRAYAGAA